MPVTAVTVTGITETNAMLTRLPKSLVARGFLKGLEAAGAVIEAELYARTPERAEGDRNEDEIHLRDSLVVAAELDSQMRGGQVNVGFGKKGHVALWLEYGHRMIGHKPGKKDTGKMVPAYPFMRSTAVTVADDAIQAFADALAETLRAGI